MIVYYCAKNSRRGFHEEQKVHEHVKENLMMVLKLKELFSQSKYLCLIFVFSKTFKHHYMGYKSPT